MDKKNAAFVLFSIAFVFGLLFITIFSSQEPTQDVTREDDQVVPREDRDVSEPLDLYGLQIEVQDDDGVPLPGAEIDVLDSEANRIKTASTNERGLALLEIELGAYVIAARHPKCFDAESVLIGEGDVRRGSVSIMLEKQRRIAGIVQNETGEAISNAKIEVSFEDREIDATTSDEEGAFHVYPLRKGNYVLDVSHSEYFAFTSEFAADTDDAVITLQRHCDLRILVKDAGMHPVPGAPVALRSIGESVRFAQREANVHGEALFRVEQPGRYVVSAESPYHAQVSAATEVKITSSAEASVTLQLDIPTFQLAGRVLDIKTSEAVVGATVEYQGAAGESEQSVTNELGEFHFADLSPGVYQLHVHEIEGYLSGNHSHLRRYGAHIPERFSYTLDENIDDLILWLKPSWRLQGKVVSDEGRPLPEAEVALWLSFRTRVSVGYAGSTDTGIQTLTDDNGEFEIVGSLDYSLENANLWLRSRHYQYGNASSDSLKPEYGEVIDGIVIRHGAQGNVYGTVVDHNGAPVNNAFVSFNSSNPHEVISDGLEHHLGHARTDVQGRYAAVVKAGQGYASAEAEGLTDEQSYRRVDIPTVGSVEINFTLSPGDTSIKGAVIGPQGEGVANAKIFTMEYRSDEEAPPHLGLEGATTDQAGRFEIDFSQYGTRLVTHHFKVTAAPDSPYESAVVDGVKVGDDVTIRVEKGEDKSFTLRGVVMKSDRSPVESYEALLVAKQARSNETNLIFNEDVSSWTPFRSPSGEFILSGDNADAGPFRVAAYSPEYGLALSDFVDVSPGEVRRDIVIVMGSVNLHGRLVHGGTGDPLPEARVAVHIAGDSVFADGNQLQSHGFMRRFGFVGSSQEQAWLTMRIPSAVTNSNGEFTLQGLPQSNVWLVVNYGGFYPFTHRVDQNRMMLRQDVQLGDLGLTPTEGAPGAWRTVDVDYGM